MIILLSNIYLTIVATGNYLNGALAIFSFEKYSSKFEL